MSVTPEPRHVVVRLPARSLALPTAPRGDEAALVGHFAADVLLREALEVSSPSLARALEEAAAGRLPRRAAARRRLVLALTAYRLRMAHRPTPFGLLAGLTTARVGEPDGSHLSAPPRWRLRPDSGWLAALVARLEAGPLAGPGNRIRLTAHPLAVRRGSRYVLDGDVTVRATALVETLMRATAAGAGLAELLAALTRAAPTVPEARFAEVVRDLVHSGFLLTDLLPPPGTADPLGHLLDRLGDHPLRRPLSALRGELAMPRPRPPGSGATRLARLSAGLHAVHLHEPALRADLLPDAPRLTVPPAVLGEARRAADVLLRCAPPNRAPGDGMAAYWHRFVDRYGSREFVPLLELTDPMRGLGLPSFRAGTATTGGSDAVRERLLGRLVARAVADGRTEVSLDTALVDRLAGRPRPPEPSGRALELHALLLTRGKDRMARGDFQLAVSAQGLTPYGAALGRFAGLTATPGPDLGPGCHAEVVFRPRDDRMGNVLADTGWLAHRIPVGIGTSRAGDLPLSRLAVGDRGGRLGLAGDGADGWIEPVCFAAPRPDLLPGLVRFLLALGGGDGVEETWNGAGWDWGAARGLPFLPRVRTGRTILSPARWNPPVEVVEAAGDASAWDRALDGWRKADALPDTVAATVGDQPLPLDLDDPVHRELLRREFGRGDPLVTELPGGEEVFRAQGWPTGPDGPYLPELVVPVPRAPHPETVPPPRRGPWSSPAPSVGSWLYAELRVPAAEHAEVAVRLRELLPEPARHGEGTPAAFRWFFLRGEDTLRLRLPHREAEGLMPKLHTWAFELRSEGLAGALTLDSGRPELHRFGGPAASAAAEQVLTADSWYALELLADPGPPLLGAALSVLDLVTAFLAGDPARLPGVRLSAPERARFQELRQQVRRSAGSPRPGPAAARRRAAAGAHGRVLGDLTGKHHTPLTREAVAADLAHLHCNRLLGPDPAAERVVLALARDAATSLRTRSPGKAPDA